MSLLRLAVVQAPAELDGVAARLGWLAASLPDIVAQNADLVLLPELFVCGYNIGDLVEERAEAADGPVFQAISFLARQYGIAIHYGFAEREDGRLYNSALCVGPDGEVLGRHRKLVIPPGDEVSHFSAGQGCRLFTYKGFSIATLICYDAEFAETVRHVAVAGAELVLVPTALGAQWGWVAHSMMPTRAYENGVYLAYANSAGNERGMAFLGGSVIAAPDGVEAARAEYGPTVLYADLDKNRVSAAQARLPYLEDRAALRLP